MKTSLIITVRNEENTIKVLLDSILKQTIPPEEVIITDAKSSDSTAVIIQNYIPEFKKKNIILACIIQKGNRAQGRNEAISRAKSEVLLITDAGCVLDKHWIEEITLPFAKKNVDVVAGYYKGLAKNIFEKCVIPYFLVMPDKVDSETFLPATRSMAIRKSIWQEIGGFPEKYARNEDYVFARELRTKKKKIIFSNKAIVNWMPPTSIPALFSMFCRHAFGDAEAGIFRKKVMILFVRYSMGLFILLMSLFLKNYLLFLLLIIGNCLYVFWSIRKNYKYVKDIRAYFILPFIQYISDISVLVNTILGCVKRSLMLLSKS